METRFFTCTSPPPPADCRNAFLVWPRVCVVAFAFEKNGTRQEMDIPIEIRYKFIVLIQAVVSVFEEECEECRLLLSFSLFSFHCWRCSVSCDAMLSMSFVASICYLQLFFLSSFYRHPFDLCCRSRVG